MTRFVDSKQIPQRGVRNILSGISDPSSRRWRVKTVGGTAFKPHSVEIEHTLANGAILLVHRDGWMRLDTRLATLVGTQSYALSVVAEADDGAATFTDSLGVVLERAAGSTVSTTVTVSMADFAPTWTPATLTPEFWLRPNQTGTHIAALLDQTTNDYARRCATIGAISSAFGTRRTTDLPVLVEADLVTPQADQFPKVEQTVESLCTRFRRMTFDTPAVGQTVMFVCHNQRNAGLESSRVVATSADAISVRETSRAWIISGATGTVRVNGSTAALQPAYGYQWNIVVARLDSAATWEAIAGSLLHIRDLVIVSGSVSDADAERYEGWVAHSFDLAHLLPRNHPYRYGPPGNETPSIEPTPWPTGTIKFGSRTRAGMGGIPVPRLAAQTITAGNALGHWEIAEGRLRPTAAFDSANPAAGTTYSLTISGVTVPIEIVTDGGRPRYDVASGAELIRVFPSVAASGGDGVADTSIVLRAEGRYEGFSNYDFSPGTNGSVIIKPEVPGGVVSGPIVISTATNCTLQGIDAHWRYTTAFDNAGTIRVLQFSGGRIERCTSRGYYFDWGIGFDPASPDRWTLRRYDALNGILAKDIFYSEVYNCNVVGSCDVFWGNTVANALGDGPANSNPSLVTAYNLHLDNPYVSGQKESDKHSDMLGQVGTTPNEINLQCNFLVANSPLLAAATGGDSQGQRGLYLESTTNAHAPAQTSGLVARNLVVGKIANAALDINNRAQPGLLLTENMITNNQAAGARGWQGGFNAQGIAHQPTDVSINDVNRLDCIEATALPTDRVTRRTDIIAYARPKAGGPLDLGGGATAGAVTLAGALKPPVLGLTPRKPVEITATATAAGFKVTTIPTNATPNGTIDRVALAYTRERTPGVGEFWRSRNETSATNRRLFKWVISSDSGGDNAISEGEWKLIDPYTPDTEVVVSGAESYRVAIQQRNEHGWSPWSESISTGIVAVANTTPVFEEAPTLVAGAGSLLVTLIEPPSGGSAITSYDIRYSLAGLNTWTTLTNTGLTETITGLTGDAAYDVQARAISALGTGPWSGTAVGTPFSASNVVLSTTGMWMAATNSANQIFDIPVLAAAEGQPVLIGISWYSATARTISTITFSRQDGTEPVTGVALIPTISVTGGTISAGTRKTILAARAPAAGWTTIRVAITLTGLVRAVPYGAAVLDVGADITAPLAAANYGANTVWQADPTASITTRAGGLLTFGRLEGTGLTITIAGQTVVVNEDSAGQYGFVGHANLTGPTTPNPLTVTADSTPDSSTGIRAAGIMVVSIPLT